MRQLIRVRKMKVVLGITAMLLGSIFVTSCASLHAESSKAESITAETTSDQEIPAEVSVCQLAADPAKYNHKLVKVSAFFSHGFEDSSVYDPACDSRFNIWFEYGGKNVTGTMYCCGVTAARKRPEMIEVENIPIPLLVNNQFKTFDNLLHSRGDSVLHATVIGRFFAGEKTKVANGEERWMGYGHMGMSSLLVLQEVVKTDLRDRNDLDYRASPDQPDMKKIGCGYRFLMEMQPFQRQLAIQREAEAGPRAWAFEDSERTAIDVLASLTKRPIESIKGLQIAKRAQGQIIYEWYPKGENKMYMVVLSRPYELSFYAKSNKVAWVPAAAYESICE